MKLTLLSVTFSAACAFTPSHVAMRKTSLHMSETESSETVPEVAEVANEEPTEAVIAPPTVAAINGWVPDDSKPCYGLPGKAMLLIHT